MAVDSWSTWETWGSKRPNGTVQSRESRAPSISLGAGEANNPRGARGTSQAGGTFDPIKPWQTAGTCRTDGTRKACVALLSLHAVETVQTCETFLSLATGQTWRTLNSCRSRFSRESG